MQNFRNIYGHSYTTQGCITCIKAHIIKKNRLFTNGVSIGMPQYTNTFQDIW